MLIPFTQVLWSQTIRGAKPNHRWSEALLECRHTATVWGDTTQWLLISAFKDAGYEAFPPAKCIYALSAQPCAHANLASHVKVWPPHQEVHMPKPAQQVLLIFFSLRGQLHGCRSPSAQSSAQCQEMLSQDCASRIANCKTFKDSHRN